MSDEYLDSTAIEQAVLRLLASDGSVNVPLLQWFDPVRQVAFFEWRGETTLRDFVLNRKPQECDKVVRDVVGQFVAMERRTMAAQADFEALASRTPRMSADRLAEKLAAAAVSAATILCREAPPQRWIAAVQDAIAGIAVALVAQPQTVGVGDLSPENVVLALPSMKPAFVDFEYVGTSSTAERLVLLLNQPGIPVCERAVALLDRNALQAFQEAGGDGFLRMADNLSAAEVLDCCVGARYWRFIAHMVELCGAVEGPEIVELSKHYGDPRSRIEAAVRRYMDCPALSDTGPGARFRGVIGEAPWPWTR